MNNLVNPGTEACPIDISSLGIDLSDLKILTLLISDDDHASVGNLTEQKVGDLDQLA